MENKKKIIMVVLSVLVCIMAVGYAVLAQQLNITGTTSIDSTWKVEITNIQEKEIVGDATSKVTPSYTATTANFNVGLTQPGDSITYDIEISNLGTLNAVLESINVTMDENEAIKYTTSGLKRGDKLGAGNKTKLTIKVEYDSSVTSQPSVTTKDITVTLNYQQDLGQVVVYDEYAVGDIVTYNGMNFYVIADSDETSDTVTMLKAEPLTVDEVEAYGIDSFGVNHVNKNYFSLSIGEAYSYDDGYGGVQYYSSDECNGQKQDKCTTDYLNSDIKFIVDNWVTAKINISNLKEVDGYRARLITYDELTNNLGYSKDIENYISPSTNGETPTWVSDYYYWTMSNLKNSSIYVYNIQSNGVLSGNGVFSHVFSSGYYQRNYPPCVRPVINLLKSSI